MKDDKDEALWRQRFLLVSITRLFGLGLMIAGVFIGFTDLVKPGGWTLLGLVLAAAGAADLLIIPLVLKKSWDRQ